MVVALLVELALSHAIPEVLGLKPSANRVLAEWHVFDTTFDQPFLLVDPRQTAERLKVHVRQLHRRLRNASPIESPFLRRFRSQLYANVDRALPTVELFSLRVLSLLASLPIILIGCMVIGLDGWVRREVRKAGAGIESARIYHVAKRSIKPICMWVSLVYLVAPVTLDVRWAYGLLAIVIPVLVGMTISRFKKYV